MENIKFWLSNCTYIEFCLDQLNDVASDICIPCYQVDVNYIDEKNNINISFGYETISSIYFLGYQSSKLYELIQGSYKLSKNPKINLGFDHNEFYANQQEYNKDFMFLWMSNSHKQIFPYYDSWLYNDQQGNIVFEITPFYSWHEQEPMKDERKNFISYDEWIKSYRSIVTTTVPVKNLKQWIKQAQALSKLLEEQDQMSCH